MDEHGLQSLINKFGSIKFKFAGVFSADKTPTLVPNTFVIINTDKSGSQGEHWVMLARVRNRHFFGDSMGKSVKHYKNLKNFPKVAYLNEIQMQQDPICGLYSIYFALKLFDNVPTVYNDRELLLFFNRYL